jgi:hypothetical protein
MNEERMPGALGSNDQLGPNVTDSRAPLPDHDNHHNALRCPYCNPDRLVLVSPKDANDYCRVLTALGMEEEGDPVAGIERLRAVLAELVALKDIKDKGLLAAAESSDGSKHWRLQADYERRKPLAWAAAREALGPNE